MAEYEIVTVSTAHVRHIVEASSKAEARAKYLRWRGLPGSAVVSQSDVVDSGLVVYHGEEETIESVSPVGTPVSQKRIAATSACEHASTPCGFAQCEVCYGPGGWT